ncbi:trypsin inhibitor-like [Episyrphus balteatus]|uniref:trypsin inhibitor-like n=1 Tax=Episyrphus balteatus TaxID=286459 RepID=UPI00248585F3|nr:trypsin inhibitor-like [Episyrphus balteatus]
MKLLFALLVVVVSLFVLASAGRPAACSQPHAFNGENPCRGFMPSWSYDKSANNCVKFIFGGCNGNDNIFDTKEDCEALCKK